MLKRTGASQIFVSQDATIRDIALEALSHVPAGQVTLREMPVFEDLFPTASQAGNTAFEAEVEFPKVHDVNAVAAILHSSGMLSDANRTGGCS